MHMHRKLQAGELIYTPAPDEAREQSNSQSKIEVYYR